MSNLNQPVNNQRGYIQIILGVLILLLIVGSGAYYLGTQKNKSLSQSKVQNSPTPSSSQPSPPPTVNIKAQNTEWEEYTSNKLPNISFKAYKIIYPATWAKKINREAETVDILTLSKDDHFIEIWQGPTDGGGCVFEGDMPEGPYSDYRNTPYIEIESKIGTLRRVLLKSNKPNQAVFGFCVSSKDKKFYGSPSIVGSISYTVPSNYNKTTLKEMDKIVSTLQEASMK